MQDAMSASRLLRSGNQLDNAMVHDAGKHRKSVPRLVQPICLLLASNLHYTPAVGVVQISSGCPGRYLPRYVQCLWMQQVNHHATTAIDASDAGSKD